MKKIFFIFLLAVIGLTAKSFGQGTCQNAQNLYPSDTAIQLLSANDTVAWYVYNATTPYLSIQVLMLDSIFPNCKIQLYTGNCNNLTFMDSSNCTQNLTFYENALTVGNTYYLKFTKPYLSPSVKFILNIWASILECNDNTCHDGQSSSPITPGYSCDLVCNGNFEYYSSIPTYTGQIGLACPWGSVNDADPDYFNGIANGTNPGGYEIGVPYNTCCSNQPDIITGHKGYAGFAPFTTTPPSGYNSYEYIYQPLKQALLPGIWYTVSLDISRACNYNRAVDNIGVFLSGSNPYIGSWDFSSGTSTNPNTNSIPYSTNFPNQTWI